MDSQAVIPAALPGNSNFNCVPLAIKLSINTIVAGFMDTVASPPVLHLPYLKRKPPFLSECENTGLPATISSINFSEFLLSSSFFSSLISEFMKSHPSIFILSTIPLIFLAFCINPSATTRHIPPRTLLVSTSGRSLKPETSSSSVPSPSIQTGQFFIVASISFGDGLY